MREPAAGFRKHLLYPNCEYPSPHDHEAVMMAKALDCSQAVGIEPTRANTVDFKSTPLTTRARLHVGEWHLHINFMNIYS